MVLTLTLATVLAMHPLAAYAEEAQEEESPPQTEQSEGGEEETTPQNEGEEEETIPPETEEGEEETSPQQGGQIQEGTPESTEGEEADAPLPTPIIGLPGPSFDVAFARSVAGLHAGSSLEPGRGIVVPEDGCLRLSAGLSAAVSLCGPARGELSVIEGRLVLRLSTGRGLLSADDRGAALEVAGRHIEVRGGTVYFATSGSRPATLVSGDRASLDGEPLAATARGREIDELLSPSFCTPPLPTFSIPLGDPAALVEETAQARAQGGEGGEEAATAEGGATCVDSADSSAATDPNQGTDGGIDPDARRREPGRLRLIIHLPR